MIELKNVDLMPENNSSQSPILKGISLRFEDGKFYAITGPNGSGKTSLAKVIMGIYRPSGGFVYLDGRDITPLNVTERARLGISYAFQNPPRFRGLTVDDLLKTASGKQDNAPAVKAALRAVGLCPADYVDKEADARLSGGEMKRIELATVFVRKPRYAVLDEPEAGVDLWGYDRLVRLLKDGRRRDGCTIVITHQEKIMAQADEIVLMASGEVRASGARESMLPLLKDNTGLCTWRKQCVDGDDDVECD